MIDGPNVMPCQDCGEATSWIEPDPTLPRHCARCLRGQIIRRGIRAMIAAQEDDFYGDPQLQQAIADVYNRTVANGGTTLTFYQWTKAIRNHGSALGFDPQPKGKNR